MNYVFLLVSDFGTKPVCSCSCNVTSARASPAIVIGVVRFSHGMYSVHVIIDATS